MSAQVGKGRDGSAKGRGASKKGGGGSAAGRGEEKEGGGGEKGRRRETSEREGGGRETPKTGHRVTVSQRTSSSEYVVIFELNTKFSRCIQEKHNRTVLVCGGVRKRKKSLDRKRRQID